MGMVGGMGSGGIGRFAGLVVMSGFIIHLFAFLRQDYYVLIAVGKICFSELLHLIYHLWWVNYDVLVRYKIYSLVYFYLISTIPTLIE